MRSKQGYSYPIVEILGPQLGAFGGWLIETQQKNYGWDSVALASEDFKKDRTNNEIINCLNKKPWFTMPELVMTQDEMNQAEIMFNILLEECDESYFSYPSQYHDSAIYTIIDNNNNVFWTGGVDEFYSLPIVQRFKIVAKIHLYWAYLSQQWQIKNISQYCKDNNINDSFPFSSSTTIKWFHDNVLGKDFEEKEYFNHYNQFTHIFVQGIPISTGDETTIFTKLPRTSLHNNETYSNLYKYNVEKFYNSTILLIVWSLISIGMFSTSIIVYRKTDFK